MFGGESPLTIMRYQLFLRLTHVPSGSTVSPAGSDNFRYIVTKDGVSHLYSANADSSLPLIPTSAGKYTIKCEIKFGARIIASKSVEYTVGTGSVSGSALTICYKGYSTPNIHYQVGSGSWTAVPGVAMAPTNERPGYTHKYTIDLGSSTYANVCFNDGNGSWDSRNGANYRVESGTYTCSNGTITKQ